MAVPLLAPMLVEDKLLTTNCVSVELTTTLDSAVPLFLIAYVCFVAGVLRHELPCARVPVTASEGTLPAEVIWLLGLFVPVEVN